VGRVEFRAEAFRRYRGAAIGESVVVVTMMMVFPFMVATIVMPPALVAVIPFIAVSIAMDRSWCVEDPRRSLVHDWRRCDIDGAGHTQKNSNVRVGESRARCARSGNAHC
jgi:hypothetical protein